MARRAAVGRFDIIWLSVGLLADPSIERTTMLARHVREHIRR
jgi:hypothetical protein